MIKQLLKCIREYKKASLLTLLFMVGEAVIETFIPFITAMLVNKIKGGADIGVITSTGLILVAMAMVSLSCGGAAGFTCSKASAGFAKNLRHDMLM